MAGRGKRHNYTDEVDVYTCVCMARARARVCVCVCVCEMCVNKRREECLAQE